jgi:uncharacterized protein YhbP (UPF0306 family)
MNVEELVRQYLPGKPVMQLATSHNDQPWVCTVAYMVDKDLNMYWISTNDRRHSKEVAANPKVAVSILAHEASPDEPFIAGISVEGTAEIMTSGFEDILNDYKTKHPYNARFVEGVLKADDSNQLYKLTPKKFVLFDTKNLEGNPRQEWTLS